MKLGYPWMFQGECTAGYPGPGGGPGVCGDGPGFTTD